MFTEIHLDHFSTGIPAIALLVTIAGLGQIIFRKIFGRDHIRECHEVGGYYMQVTGTLYAVLLGLIVYDAMGKFQTAKNYLETEATSLMEIYLVANKMPVESRAPLRSTIKQYVDDVIDKEWALMELGKKSETARVLMFELTNLAINIEPGTENQRALYPMMISCLDNAWKSRRARINFAEYRIPPVEWTILLIGGCITIFFTYFFAMSKNRTQFLLTGLVTLTVTMNLYLILLFGEPFSGDLRVTNNSFELVKQQIQIIEQESAKR